MKINLFSNLLITIVLISLFQACDRSNSDDEDNQTDKHLISFEKTNSYKPEFIKSILTPLEGEYPELASIIQKVEYSVTVYKISYITSFKGNDIAASGLVCIPSAANSLPVLSFQNGTNTLHSNAPSVNPNDGIYMLLEFVSATGFIITIPDYLGFGDSDNMFHPYLDYESTVQSIVDMQRAVKEMANDYLDVKLNNDYYITGYSQGGWSTLQLQKAIEKDYSSEFNLKASVCSAGPYDLNFFNNYIMDLDEYPMPYFLGYLFNSYYNLGGITTPVEEVFKSPYDTKILTLYDGTKSGGEINNELTTVISQLFTADFINNYDTDPKFASIKEMLTKNSIEAWKATTPTLLIHGTDDDFVPTLGSNKMFQEFLNAGVEADKIKLILIPGATHQTGAIPSGITAINWFLKIRDGE